MKLLLKIVLVLVILVLLAVGAGLLYVDAAAKAAVERGGTYALGVDTRLDSADVQILAGRFAMGGLGVANPAGFDEPHFLTLGAGDVSVTLASLREDTVELPALTLSDVDVALERKGGKANYDVIVENLKRLGSTEPPPQEQAGGKKFVIREVVIRDVNVSVELLPIGGDATRVDVPIEEIRLENVGSESDGGVILAELTSVIMRAIFAAAVQLGGDVIPGEILGSLDAALDELGGLREIGFQAIAGGGEVVQELLGGAEKAAEGLGKDVGEAVEGAAKAAEEIGSGLEGAAKDLEKGLGGLLGGKKDDGR